MKSVLLKMGCITHITICAKYVKLILIIKESFNKERFYKNGVNIIIPSLEERQLVHDIIFAELCRGIITNNSKEQYKKIIYKYCKGKETGVILGCTEIGLLIQQNFMDVPIFDTTQIHAKKIAMYMIE